ncbi:decaprenyl-phosphate phosphoribosyltransferase [bacterium AH-315-K03]|nr:decaprenyl-phosphate phosphoribosyltransferase [bacterium AH-315-K03]
MRPIQWIKNLFVLAPLIFSGLFLESSSIYSSLLAMGLFCLASSAAYIVNDIKDIKKDRQHPKKQHQRPLASGKIKINHALYLLGGIYSFLIYEYFQQPEIINIIFCYILINILYSFIFKHIAVLDIFSIASGFVLRVYAGAIAISVTVSPWMLVTTLCIALYLAAIKRQQELKNIGHNGRKVLDQYTVALADRYAGAAGIGAFIFYSLFVITTNPNMVLTIPLVLYGLFRYWFLVEIYNNGESVIESLLSDWQLMLSIILWIGTCLWILWPSVI